MIAAPFLPTRRAARLADLDNGSWPSRSAVLPGRQALARRKPGGRITTAVANGASVVCQAPDPPTPSTPAPTHGGRRPRTLNTTKASCAD
jgi:hypothetical protein